MSRVPEPAVTEVDDRGVLVTTAEDLLCDVLFDGRRIWSFWVRRDGERTTGDQWLVPWPVRLRNHLQGTTLLTVRPHGGQPLFEREVHLGHEDRRLTVVDRAMDPLVIDNYGRLVKTFETKAEGQLAPLLDALVTVLDLLHAEGLAAFPAYGTLLGAVREGTFIGHDTDADVGYVSRFTHPVDVIRESFRVQRAVQRRGYPTTRYSGAAFMVTVTEADGSARGLDVFGGFFIDGRLALMGEVFTPFEDEWILPLGSVQLDGRTLPAPARPEKLLEAMYGAGWRVPDPAFKFEKDPAAQRRFDTWFRGTRLHRQPWDHRYGLARRLPPYQRPHDVAELLHDREPPEAWVVDVGCGRGRDARWLAKQGRETIGLDYSAVALSFIQRRATETGWPVTLSTMNLLDVRQVLGWGALLGARPGPRALLGRHVIDSTDERGARNFWRFARMLLATTGGRAHVEFLTAPIEDLPNGKEPLVRPLDAGDVERAARQHGGRVVAREDLVGQPIDAGHGEEMSQDKQWHTCRLEVEW